MLRTALCDLLGIEYPIVQSGLLIGTRGRPRPARPFPATGLPIGLAWAA
jgi:hypothetical protein